MKLKHIEKGEVTLKRELGLFTTTAFGVGIILGAGIYVLVGVAAGVAGNAVWMSFVIASLMAVFTGLSYAELSSLYPEDAGEYIYAERAFGRVIGFFIGYLSFLAMVIVVAAVALGFAGYFASLFSLDYPLLIAMGIILLFGWVNYRGIKGSAFLNVIFTLLETAGLVFIIVIALPRVGSVDYFEMANGMKGVFNAASLVFFAFVGFESIVKLSEETKEPTKTIPRAILLSVIISTVLYVLIAICAVSVIDWQTLAVSRAPLADIAAALMGNTVFVILSVIALFSTGNTVLIALIAASRTLYGVAKDYPRLRFFRTVSAVHQTPSVAVAGATLLSLLFVLPGDVSLVAEYSNFGIFTIFFIVNAALIALRFKQPALNRPFRVPIHIGKMPVLPFIGCAVSIFMICNLQQQVIIGGLVYSLIGFVVYAVLRARPRVPSLE